MKMKLIAIFAVIFVTVLATPEDELINGTRIFAAKLYKELTKTYQNENVIFSPITIQVLMGVLSSASKREEIEFIQQIRTALSLPVGEANRQTAFKSVLAGLNQADNDFKVFDATKMYLKSDYEVAPWYQTTVENTYGAEIETVDFGNSWDTSQNINQWVATNTNNKITNFVDSDDISRNTEIILINALYLMGKWDKPFLRHENIIRNFNSPDGAKPVTMMTNNKTYDYYENTDAQYLKFQMLRDGGEAEMVFVLPRQQRGLNHLEQKIEKLLQPVPFSASKVNVTLPKFSFSSDLKLKPALQNMGVTRLFRLGGKLKGLTAPGHAYVIITDVLQKAFIKLDEWGVTATAVGDALVTVDATDSDTKVFTADHPFLFYITVDAALVYAGRVMQI